MNISGTVNVLRLLVNPALCLPHHTCATFDQLPIPLSAAFSKHGEKRPDIRAVVLDKDNCFAIPKQNSVYPAYEKKFEELRKAYPGSRLLIVSNTAGTNSDNGHADADLIERTTGVKVLHHATKKPGCHEEVMSYFRNQPDAGVTHPGQVAVVGDRLFTDVMMANMMGSHGFWIKDGVVRNHGLSRYRPDLEDYTDFQMACTNILLTDTCADHRPVQHSCIPSDQPASGSIDEETPGAWRFASQALTLKARDHEQNVAIGNVPMIPSMLTGRPPLGEVVVNVAKAAVRLSRMAGLLL
ncbi:hypothetical protein LTR78_000508 [Recurvomyces mirabilis]|uniref:HAD-superfamily phosphatase n=1 Tax=Recurvomyces mirabilis TaxID=574656 RepID=A0AAE0WY78_9PEZI|nr:hypothetical protein LTR78_000508 [Recurvomyces mirabilis]KAK5162163.1 hypothetical protein LTS14_000509 [Recurvomyces mirabilis]